MMALGIYIHIPFCLRKCYYCDFPSIAGSPQLMMPYAAAVCREIANTRQHRGQLVDTVYIGGGTPTVLPTEQLADIIAALSAVFDLSPQAEISIEANPGTVTADSLKYLKQAGFNRISFGVQSFHDDILKVLGRIHTALEGRAAVAAARAAGFDNINIDLMSGLPCQNRTVLADDINQTVALGVSHISVYSLIVEPGTQFADAQKAGHLQLPSEDDEVAMYDFTAKHLPQCGFERYEISNYAVPGRQCRHNLKYWHYQPYLGFGAAACSFTDHCRRTNQADVSKYIACIQQDTSPLAAIEHLDVPTAQAEYMFMGLRMRNGIAKDDFAARFGRTLDSCYAAILSDFMGKGLLRDDGRRVWLTDEGMKFGNQIFASFLPD